MKRDKKTDIAVNQMLLILVSNNVKLGASFQNRQKHGWKSMDEAKFIKQFVLIAKSHNDTSKLMKSVATSEGTTILKL